nr:DUF4377 domain-containing protein [Prevotella sp.]
MRNLIKTLLFLLLLLLLVPLMGCTDDNENDNDTSDTVVFTVSAYTVKSVACMTNTAIEKMLVKIGDDDNYQNIGLDAISGFHFERGYEYKLLVKRTILANPPADGSDRTYELVKIISKTSVEAVHSTVTLDVYCYSDLTTYPGTLSVMCDGMKIKESNDADWSVVPFGKIDGFTWEEYYMYSLLVEKIVLPESNIAPYCQNVQYVLKEVLSKLEVDLPTK